MYFIKFFTALSVLIAISQGKVINVKNSHSRTIVVRAGDAEVTVASGEITLLTSADEWTGTISALPLGAEVTNGPRTRAELSLTSTGDSYSVSVVDGFNLGIKIIPNGSTGCSPAICSANLLAVCPVADQVTNSVGAVVACRNSPAIMVPRCPLAVADELTSVNVKTCAVAESYLVIFN